MTSHAETRTDSKQIYYTCHVSSPGHTGRFSIDEIEWKVILYFVEVELLCTFAPSAGCEECGELPLLHCSAGRGQGQPARCGFTMILPWFKPEEKESQARSVHVGRQPHEGKIHSLPCSR